MSKHNLFLSILLLFFTINLFSTGDSLYYLTHKDTIFLRIGNYGEKIFDHIFEKHQTLFSLSRFYGLELDDIYFYNPDIKGRGVSVGQKVVVPIPNKAIKRYSGDNFKEKLFIPIYYVVEHGDNLYRIAKHYFKIPVDTVIARNNLKTRVLHSGQKLFMGWMNINGVPYAWRTDSRNPIMMKSKKNRAQFFKDYKKGKSKKTQRGAAYWKKSTKKSTKLYALHQEAPINSVISVTNPMSKRTVYLKVIGRVPSSASSNEYIVILSETAAKLLHAHDPKFYVEVEYLK